mgnify:CR=1 FL=1
MVVKVVIYGVKMLTKPKLNRGLIGLIVLFLTALATAQSLPGDLTPEMVTRLKSMSPEQQQALARQYGIEIPGDANNQVTQDLASPGQALTSAQGAQWDLAAILGQTELPEEGRSESESEELKRYGQNLFDSEVSTFAPTDNAPVPSTYRLGVGDQLIVQLFGKENEQINLQVDRSGDAVFPRLGSMTLAGLSFDDAKKVIKTRVSQQLIGVDAVISMGSLRAINVFMSGEVSVPGAYSMSALTTVTQALFQAGGVTDIGSLRGVQVRRGPEVIAVFDAYDLLMRGDASNDVRLTSGDVVYVPTFSGEVNVLGAVKRPMIYELIGSETIADVLSMAGSFTRAAFPSATLLTRNSEELGLASALTVDLNSESALDMPVQNGDIFNIPEISDLITNSVSLKGAVTRPGNYGWYADMRVSDLIGNARRDLSRNADLNLGMVIRQINDLLDIEVLAFNPSTVIASPKSESDIALKEFDEVLIFSLVTADLIEESNEDTGADIATIGSEADVKDLTTRAALLEPVISKLRSQARQGQPVQLVSVSGAVRAPGTYPLVRGSTLGTLIDIAGGLNDSAFLGAAELRRLSERSGGEVVADYEEINLGIGGAGIALELASRDHLTVRNIPDWSPTDKITIEGEVKFPGSYRIRKGETLTTVIARAGGFTTEASLSAAIFTRESLAALEAAQAADFSREIQSSFATRLLTEETTKQSLADISQIITALEATEGNGRLLIDLPSAMSGNISANIEVINGDKLSVPRVSNTVTIVGEVKRSGTHTFQEELSLNDYIDLSAGFTRRADEGQIYIVRANGEVANLSRELWLFTPDTAVLDPGDTVVVPINTQYKESLASWREITQIIYQSVVSIAAVAKL